MTLTWATWDKISGHRKFGGICNYFLIINNTTIINHINYIILNDFIHDQINQIDKKMILITGCPTKIPHIGMVNFLLIISEKNRLGDVSS